MRTLSCNPESSAVRLTVAVSRCIHEPEEFAAFVAHFLCQPSGLETVLTLSRSGGVASLSPRLQAAIPPGSLRHWEDDDGVLGEGGVAFFAVDAVVDFERLGHVGRRVAAEAFVEAGAGERD